MDSGSSGVGVVYGRRRVRDRVGGGGGGSRRKGDFVGYY